MFWFEFSKNTPMINKISVSIILSALLTGCGWGGWDGTDNPTTTPEKVNNIPDTTGFITKFNFIEKTWKKVIDILWQIKDKDGDPISVSIPKVPNYIIYKDWKLTIDTDAIDVADNQTKTDVLDLEISDGKNVLTKQVTVNITDEANDAYMTSNLTLENITKGQDLEISLVLNDADAPNAGTLANTINATISSDNFADTQVTLNLENGVYKATVSGLDAWNYTFKTEEITPVISGENPQENVVVEKDFTVNEAPVIDTTAPTLSTTDKTFVTTVWNSLVFENVTWSDDVDKNVVVVRTWEVDFNTAGTYTLIYTATDKAGNVKKAVHTYVVNEAVPAPSWGSISDIVEGDDGWKNFNVDFSSYIENANGGIFSASWLPTGLSIDWNSWVVSWYFDADPSEANRDWDWNVFNIIISYIKDWQTYSSNTFSWKIDDEG